MIIELTRLLLALPVVLMMKMMMKMMVVIRIGWVVCGLMEVVSVAWAQRCVVGLVMCIGAIVQSDACRLVVVLLAVGVTMLLMELMGLTELMWQCLNI